ncbi:MAG: NrfD/PsrC family molybdoenzyme membrane anchor subunit [Thermoleophilaceae bacterium]
MSSREREQMDAARGDDARRPGPSGGETPRGEPAEDSFAGREASVPEERDATPALGTRGGPGPYGRAREGAGVALHGEQLRGHALVVPLRRRGHRLPERHPDLGGGRRPAPARRRRAPDVVQGPIVKPAVWTWEIPLYFWAGGIAAGASFVALACDLAKDHRSAAIARKVALAAVAPCPPLLVSDLGRPARFLNMLRIFKPRSPMSMGAWALTAFGNLAGLAVVADLTGRERTARVLGVGTATLGAYIGSYGGVLLASTAVPVWARSRLVLGPVFVATATATGAAATRLTLVATGLEGEAPTRVALGRVETGAMVAELVMSTIHERRLGRVGEVLEEGQAGRLFRAAKWSTLAGLALRLARRRAGPKAHHLASVLYLVGGLAFRYAWVRAGDASAHDDEAVALANRGSTARDG